MLAIKSNPEFISEKILKIKKKYNLTEIKPESDATQI